MWGDQTPRRFADAVRVAIDYLVDAGFDARSWYPTEATPEDSRTPVVAVMDLGGPDSYTSANRTLQLTGWERSRLGAFDLCADARALLVTHPGSDVVSWVRPVNTLEPTKDPVTGLWMAPATARMQLRALAAN